MFSLPEPRSSPLSSGTEVPDSLLTRTAVTGIKEKTFVKVLVKVVTHSRPTISGIYYCASWGGPVGAQSHGEGRQKIVLSQLCNFDKAVRGKEAESKKGRTGDG